MDWDVTEVKVLSTLEGSKDMTEVVTEVSVNKIWQQEKVTQ